MAKKPWFNVRRANEIERRTVDWLWFGYVPRGKLTLFTGDPQAGKSTLLCELTAALSVGRPLPGEDGPRAPERVWMMSSEDDADTTIVWRLMNQGADLENVLITEDRAPLEGKGLGELVRIILEERITCVIIDTLTTWMGGDIDMNRANEVMSWLNKLTEIAKKTGCTFILVRHRRKGGPSDPKLHAGMGSVGFTAAVRSELMATVNEKKGTRIFERSKGNIGKPPDKWYYCIDSIHDPKINPHGVFRWDRVVNQGEEDDKPAAAKVNKVPKALGRAREWLRNELKSGPVSAIELFKRAESVKITVGTLKRAKVGIAKSVQMPQGHWVWVLDEPEQGLGPDDLVDWPTDENILVC